MAAVGSCFVTPSIRSKHLSSSDTVFRLSCLRTLPVVTTVAYTHHLDSLSISIASPKRRVSKVDSSVAQEEAAAAAIETESNEVEEEKENGGEEEGSVKEEDGMVESDVGLNTKLYFGNLPYNCDSAQLAGIIQDYGSPEMVEVNHLDLIFSNLFICSSLSVVVFVWVLRFSYGCFFFFQIFRSFYVGCLGIV